MEKAPPQLVSKEKTPENPDLRGTVLIGVTNKYYLGGLLTLFKIYDTYVKKPGYRPGHRSIAG